MAITIPPNVVQIYQEGIDLIINTFGKYITIYFPQTIVDNTTDESFTDIVRDAEGALKPKYKADVYSPAPTITENTRIVKALLKFTPMDYESFEIRVLDGENILRIKSYLSDVPDLLRADYIIPDVESNGIIRTKYKLLKDPIPIGLQHSRYALSYWKQVE